MHTPICDELGIEFPIFAFTHCRDVVVAVQQGRASGARRSRIHPEQLEIECAWIDEHIGDHPYGVDIVIPNKYGAMNSDMSGEGARRDAEKMVPPAASGLRQKILADHGVRPRTRTPTPCSCWAGRGDGDPTGGGRTAASQGHP